MQKKKVPLPTKAFKGLKQSFLNYITCIANVTNARIER